MKSDNDPTCQVRKRRERAFEALNETMIFPLSPMERAELYDENTRQLYIENMQ